MMPNFLIVGAAKSGTTSLYRYLQQHPDIFMPEWKELSFFIGDPFGPIHQIKKEKHYRKLFAKVQNESAVGEASTAYLYDNEAPKRIREVLGRIKIIIILRNPVNMSYSLYNHEFRKEGETLKTFEEALEAEGERRNDPNFRKNCYGWHANYYYFHRGLYHDQVKRYIDMFGKENLYILIFEEFIQNPLHFTKKIYRFLGVDDSFVPIVRIYNPGGKILNIPRFWGDTGLFRKTFKFIFSKNALRKVPLLLRNIGNKPIQPLAESTAQSLREKFYGDICQLERLIKKDLSAWKKGDI